MSETTEELRRDEDYSNQYDASKDDALKEFYECASKMTLSVEHLVPFDAEGEEVYYLDPRLASAIDQLKTISSWFIYTIELEGKYRRYEENFIYDFQEEAMDFLHANLGYYEDKKNEGK